MTKAPSFRRTEVRRPLEASIGAFFELRVGQNPQNGWHFAPFVASGAGPKSVAVRWDPLPLRGPSPFALVALRRLGDNRYCANYERDNARTGDQSVG